MPQFEPLNLENCGDGALKREFERCVERALSDFDDPTKRAQEERTITLTVSFSMPDDDATLHMKVAGHVKLAKSRAYKSRAILDPHKKGLLQYRDMTQELPLGKVVDLHQNGGEQ